MKKLLLALAILCVAPLVTAYAGSTGPTASGVQQSGTVIAGHCSAWVAKNQLGDCGFPAGQTTSINGLVQSTTGITITGSGTTGSPYIFSSTATGSFTYPGAGIPLSTGIGWGTSYGVTGTGNVVLNNGPTFTGTVILPAGQVVNGVTLTTGGSTSNFLNANGTYSAPSGGGTVSSVFGRAGAVTATSGDYTVSQVIGAAPTASPTFTGTVTLPAAQIVNGVTLTTGGSTSNFLNANGTYSSVSNSSSISALTGATVSNSINSSSFPQTWSWNGLTTQTALSISSTSETTGQLLNLNAVTTSVGYGLSSTITGTSNTGYAGYFSNTNTTGYGIYVNGPFAVNSTYLGQNFGTTNGIFTFSEVLNNLGTTTPYTVLSTDPGKTLTHSNGSSAVAVILPSAGSTGFPNGSSYTELNLGTGALTISTSTSGFNGNTTQILHQYGWVYAISSGTTWDSLTFPGFGTITSNAITKFIDASGAWTASGLIDNGSTISTSEALSVSATGTFTNIVVTGTCTGCTGTGANFTPTLSPLGVTTTDTAGNVFQYTYFDSTTTGATAIGSPSWGVAASLASDVSLRYRFAMPPTLPTAGTLNLCTVCQANATSGVVKYTVRDADIATNNTASVGSVVQNVETQTSITWTAADNYVRTCTPLTEVPVANHISAGSITFNTTGWTLAQILSCNLTENWQ